MKLLDFFDNENRCCYYCPETTKTTPRGCHWQEEFPEEMALAIENELVSFRGIRCIYSNAKGRAFYRQLQGDFSK